MKIIIGTCCCLMVNLLFSQTQYQYSSHNRLTQVTYPTGEIIQYTYDLLGNRTAYTINNSTDVDLTIQNQSLANNTIAIGEETTASCGLHNIGTTGAGGHHLRIFLSADTNYDVSDIEIGSQYVNSLASGSSQNSTINITIPNNANTGSFYVLFFIDADEALPETDENNNIVSIPVSITAAPDQADVMVENPSCSVSTIMPGAAANINYSYTNNGTATAQQHYFRCYLSANATYEAFADVELTDAAEEHSVPIGSTLSINSSIMIPASTIPGNYYLLFIADADESLTEGDETNNIASFSIMVSGENAAPTADFSADFTTNCTNEPITFTPITTGNPTNYSWIFTGGTPATSSAPNPSVTWNSEGVYEVSLTVSNVNGSDTETKTGYITITNGGNMAAWVWAKGFGTSELDQGKATATDNSGNVYLFGSVSDNQPNTPLDFGNGVVLNLTSTNPLVIAKFDPDGNAIWAREVTGNSSRNEAIDMVCDGTYIYVFGTFNSTLTFPGGSQVNTGAFLDAIYTAKLDLNGNTDWVRQSTYNTINGNAGRAVAGAMDVDNGCVYITGYFRLNMILNGQLVSNSSSNDRDVFIAKYFANGNIAWLQSGGGTNYDYGYGVGVYGNDVNVIGYYTGSALFGSTTVSSNGASDIFVAQYSASNGSFEWVESFGGSNADFGNDLVVDKNNGNIYVTGDYINSMTIGSVTLPSVNYREAFVAKLNDSGNTQWAIASFPQLSGGNRSGWSLLLDKQGHLVLDGLYQGSLGFSGISPISAIASQQPYWAIFDLDGNALYLENIGGIYTSWNADKRSVLSADDSGNIFRPGSFIGQSTIGDFTISGPGFVDMQLSKWQAGSICNLSTSISASGPTSLCPNGSVVLTSTQSNSYLWSTGATTREITVSTPGDYTVQISDCYGCSAISEAVSVDFDQSTSITNTSIIETACEQNNGSIELTVESSFTYSSLWDNGTTTNLNNNLLAGEHSVTITPSSGCQIIETYTLGNTGTQPTANFQYETNGMTVTFTDQSLNANSINFDLGDGFSNSIENFSHTYANSGTYQVCLTTTNTCGDSEHCESISVSNILPVESLDFRATPVNNKYIQINWSVAQEVDLDVYVLERSSDQINFEPIYQQEGNSTLRYQFDDQSVQKGINYYYRLMMIDKDGHTEYSPIEIAKLELETTFSIHPNPTNGILHLNAMLDNQQHVEYAVINTIGQIVVLQNIILDKGSSSSRLDLTQLPKGTYWVRVITSGYIWSEKIILQ